MSRVTISTTYTLTCDKCKKTIEVKRDGVPTKNVLDSYKSPELKGWIIENDFGLRADQKHFTENVTELVCPDCIEKDRQRRMQSEDIFERASAGYYNGHPDMFVQDVYKHFDITESHPKIKKFWNLVCEKDTYSNQLYYIEEIIELFK